MLLWGAVGFMVGVIARYIVPDTGPSGIGGDTLVGILGGLLGGFTYHLFGHKPPVYDFDAWSVVCAAIGAFTLVLVVRAASGRRTIA